MFLDHELLTRHRKALQTLGLNTSFEFKDRAELSKRIGDHNDLSLAIYSGQCVHHYKQAVEEFDAFLAEDKNKLNEARKEVARLKSEITKVKKQAERIASHSTVELQNMSDYLQKMHQANRTTSIIEEMCLFAFNEALFNSQEAIELITKGQYEVDIARLMNEPKYIDVLIREIPEAVALKGLVYCIAQAAYEQFTQPAMIAKYISVTPWLDDEHKRSLALRALVNSTGLDVEVKIYQSGKWIANNAGKPGFIDDYSQGFHPNYLCLPSHDFNLERVIMDGRDCSGVGLSPEQVGRFKSSVESRGLLSIEFGYKKLLGITDATIHNQIRGGHVEPVLSKLDYTMYLEYMEGDWLSEERRYEP